MCTIIVSQHAAQRANERGMPMRELNRIVMAAEQRGDGIYRSQHGQAIVEHQIVCTVLAPDMEPRQKYLPLYRVRS